MKIAIVQYGSLGDCINSTLMFGPLRAHYGADVDIDVHTASIYRPAFDHNPLITRTIGYPAASKRDAFALYNTPRPTGYDLVLTPAPILRPVVDRCSLRYPQLGHNIILSFARALDDLGVFYSLPLQTTLVLTDAERTTAIAYLSKIICRHAKRRFYLIEAGAESGQTFVDDMWLYNLIGFLCRRNDAICVVSCKKLGPTLQRLLSHNKIAWVGALSVREVSVLFDQCAAFFSISSGLANACNVHGRRRDVPWFEVVNDATCSTAPIYNLGRTYWYRNDLAAFLAHLETVGL